MTTLFDLLDQQAGALAAERAFLFLSNDGSESGSLTYAELQRRSRSFAVRLQQRSKPGDCLVLALPTGPQLIVNFFGALYAGVLPVLLPVPRHERDRRSLERLGRVLEETRARYLVLSSASLKTLGRLPFSQDCEIMVDADESDGGADDWQRPQLSSASPAYIQFTSGSTAKPKGVVLKHENVLSNLELIRQVFDDDGMQAVSWLPLYHDMGLVGHLLQPMYNGGLSVLASPDFFAQDPLNWLRAIHRYRATASGAPPFAYELCAERATSAPADLDLSSWKNAYIGSEPISVEVLEDFARAYAPYGFRRESLLPCYGLAEATLFVAGKRGLDREHWKTGKEGGTTRTLLNYPLKPEFVEAHIVNPESGEPRTGDEVGEVWLSGRSVAAGYFNDAEASSLTFVNRPDEEGRTYLRTGDLGFLDGQNLYLTGRLKDLIIIRGANYCAEDIEASIRRSHSILQHLTAVCFSTPGRVTEELVVVQEVKPSSKELWPELCAAIRDNVAEECGLQIAAILLVRRGGLPRTTSGKISRAACRAAYLRAELQAEEIWRNSAAVETEARANARASGIREVAAEPIAVIGMACRFPGEADDPEAYWSLLMRGVDAISETPPERWETDLYYDPRPVTPGKMNTRWGGFLKEIEKFDAGFFGIARHEAAEIDPQQRLLLEVAWRAFEHAGLPLEQLSGQEMGVFIGISTNDYLHLQIKQSPGMERYNAYSGLGNANSISANRLSYIFNLRGPSLAVDTACSSSLTALHLAVQSLRRHECGAAVAGGVNLILSPGTTVTLSQFSMMAPDGRCKVFDASADGYVRSEGSGLVVLKRRSDAIRDGDNILAYIRGSALGQDGRSLGITAPNPEAQREVIKKALADADCRPEEITLLEAHGTGTSAGDPVELEQLKQFYGGASSAGRCYLGSVKANLGHLEAAAGVASIIKLILALQRKEIPPQIHLRELNPRISLEGSRLLIPHEPTPWRPESGRRLAAVSSFGFGGANAHAILEAADGPERIARPDEKPERILFPLSAKSDAALEEQARAWIDYLSQPRTETLSSLAYSQSVRRSHFGLRAAFVAESPAELADELRAFLQKQSSPHGATVAQRGGTRCAFLFSGQGSQAAGMGSALDERFPAFRAAFDRCAEVFESEGEPPTRSLRSLVFAPNGTELDNTLYQQPALFALEYALAKLLLSLGAQPSVLIGHSLGEYAAACIADCFDPEEGMRLVMARAHLMASIQEAGAMLAVAANETTLRHVIRGAGFESLSLAAINSPADVVLSGPVAEIERAARLLDQRGMPARRLRTSQAFHSPLMDEILDEFEQEAAGRINFRAPRIPLVSNLTGGEMRSAPDPAYWRRHLRECVRFEDGFQCLQQRGIRAFVEIGPGRALLNLVRRNAPASDPTLLPTCSGDEVDSTLRAVGQLYTGGAELRWAELYRAEKVAYVSTLPGHPFKRQRHWFADDGANESSSLQPMETAQPETAQPASFPPSRWGYHLRWVQSDAPPGVSSRLQAERDVHWIIVGDGEGLAKELANTLPQPKRQIFRISYDERHAPRGFRRATDKETGAQRFFVAPGCDAGIYGEVFNEILNRLSRADASHWNVVYLNGMGCAPAAETSVASLERDQRLHGAGDLASLAQALIHTALAMRLWIVTTNAQPVHLQGQTLREDPLNLAQSTIWGFGHTLFLEHPEMRGGQADLDERDDAPTQAAQVLCQVAAADGESLAAFRGRVRYVPRLLPATLERSDEPISFHRDGAYLITGGLGGLGLKCAQWLSERGAGRIVLLSRRLLPERAAWDTLPPEHEAQPYINSIRAIEAAGASVEVRASDVTDYARVSEIIRDIEASEYRLRGVLHAAGVNWFGKIAELDRAQLLETLKIKVAAAWHLYEETRASELDLFLLFSSVSALWGSVDLAHYTAANQFLDALAYQCRRMGRRALSINWGPWSAVGMSARTKEMRLLTKLGFRLIMPRMALGALEAALAADETRLMIADMDWRQFQAFINFSACPLLFERVDGGARITGAFAQTPNEEIKKIREASAEEARSLLRELVRGHLSSVLLLDAGQSIDVRQRFNLVGMDSLMAIAFALRLENIAGTKLPTTLAYNYPTIADVADYLFELIRKESSPVIAQQERAAANPGRSRASTDPRLWFKTEPGEATKLRLFCLPYAGAGASLYQRWPQSLVSAAEVIPVQLPGREERSDEPGVREMAEMVRRLADALLALPPAPFALFGHSLGAMIAFELARELRRRHAPLPQRLILSGCGAPNGERKLPQINRLPDEEFKRHLVEHFDTPPEVIEDEIVWQALLPSLRSDIALLETYSAAEELPLALPFSIFGSTEDKLATRETLLGWGAQTSGDFSLRLFRGGHLFLRNDSSEVLEAIRRELSPAISDEISV